MMCLKLSFLLILLACAFLLSSGYLHAKGSDSLKQNQSSSPGDGSHQQKPSESNTESAKPVPPLKADEQPASSIKKEDAKPEPIRPESNGCSFLGDGWTGSCADWAMFFATLCAVIVGLCTLRAIQAQVTANKDAAKAALEQAMAITKSERAYVFAKVVLVEKLDQVVNGMSGKAEFNRMLQYRTEFKNYGKTPANIIGLDRDAYTITTPEKIRYFSLTNQSWVYPDGLVIAGGLQWNGTKSVIIKEDWKEIIEDKKRFYCIGLIRYRDVFGDRWETGYCWEYIARQNRFRLCEEAPHLNYCREYNPSNPSNPSGV